MKPNSTFDLWNSVFPTLPTYTIPPAMPAFTDVKTLINYVDINMQLVMDNWTNAIRQGGIGGRLQMAEDASRDETFRFETLCLALESAQKKLISK